MSITQQNTGTSTWVAGGYKLGAQNPQDNTTWGVQQVELTGNVALGANATFNFTVKAPAITGSTAIVNMQWGMVQEYVA